jgi:hypothetical protein
MVILPKQLVIAIRENPRASMLLVLRDSLLPWDPGVFTLYKSCAKMVIDQFGLVALTHVC